MSLFSDAGLVGCSLSSACGTLLFGEGCGLVGVVELLSDAGDLGGVSLSTCLDVVVTSLDSGGLDGVSLSSACGEGCGELSLSTCLGDVVVISLDSGGSVGVSSSAGEGCGELSLSTCLGDIVEISLDAGGLVGVSSLACGAL